MTFLTALGIVFSCCVVVRGDVFGLPQEMTYFDAVGVSQFDDYNSFDIFTYHLLPDTGLMMWYFIANKTSDKCPTRDVHVHMQQGSYPLIRENNQTFPEDFHIYNRSEARNLTIPANGTFANFTVLNPVPGHWFAAVFLDKKDSEVVGKLTDQHCSYSFQLNVSRFPLTGIHTMPLNHLTPLALSKDTLYKFFVEQDTWQYTVKLLSCSNGSQPLDPCPLQVYVRGGGVTDSHTYSATVDCSKMAAQSCHVTVTSPQIGLWHYVHIHNTDSTLYGGVEFIMTIDTQVCVYRNTRSLRRQKRDATSVEDGTLQGSDQNIDIEIGNTNIDKSTSTTMSSTSTISSTTTQTTSTTKPTTTSTKAPPPTTKVTPPTTKPTTSTTKATPPTTTTKVPPTTTKVTPTTSKPTTTKAPPPTTSKISSLPPTTSTKPTTTTTTKAPTSPKTPPPPTATKAPPTTTTIRSLPPTTSKISTPVPDLNNSSTKHSKKKKVPTATLR